MKLKKLISIAVSAVLCLSVLTGCSSDKSSEKEPMSIGIVLGEGSINDQSFNQSTWEGLKKAEKDFGISVKYFESKQESDYIQNIETLVDEETDLIIGVGYQLKDSIEESAKDYPNQKFALMDETYDKIPENVVPVVFKEEEAAYLTGILAAKMTKTNTVGFIGGLPAPSVVKYQNGYKYGVESTNKEINVLEQFANSFSDQAKGKSIAKELVEGNYKGGVEKVYGLKEGAVGISENTNNHVPKEIIDYVNKEAEKVISGEIKVPKNEKEYKELSK